MTGFRTLAVSLLIVGIGLVPWPARADPIQITAGTLIGDQIGATLIVSGERGLEIVGGITTSGVGWPPGGPACSGQNCQPGELFSLDVIFPSSVFSGMASLDGQTFGLGTGDDQFALDVEFRGSLLLPAFTGPLFTFANAPFTFDGLLAWPVDLMRPNENLTGRGIATLLFEWGGDEFDDGWVFRRARYQFETPAPIPEPGSLLLLGSGLAGLAIRGWRRQRNP